MGTLEVMLVTNILLLLGEVICSEALPAQHSQPDITSMAVQSPHRSAAFICRTSGWPTSATTTQSSYPAIRLGNTGEPQSNDLNNQLNTDDMPGREREKTIQGRWIDEIPHESQSPDTHSHCPERLRSQVQSYHQTSP